VVVVVVPVTHLPVLREVQVVAVLGHQLEQAQVLLVKEIMVV
jgi:hypothetical protein